MNPNLYGDYKAAGALAGVFSGINQKQEEEKTNLTNTYQELKNQEQQYTSAEAQAKLQDPRYIQMKLQNDMTKFGKDTSINELESGYNKSTRAVLDLQIAAQQGPEVLQQKAIGYLQELGIDPESQQGQLMLQDPVGFAQKTQQYFAGAATQNAEYQRTYGLQEQKGKQASELQTQQDEAQMERTKLQINARAAASGGGNLSTDKEYNRQLKLALDGDEKAQRWVNAYIKNKQMVSPQYGAPAIVMGPDGQPQLGTRSSSSQVPFPNTGSDSQGSSGGSYDYVPGQGLQPTGGAQQRTPPVAGRGVQQSNTPYISKSGGVVANGRTYTYDEYIKSPVAQQYPYADLQVK